MGKRPFKGKTYFVEYEYVPENVQDINVLSLLENEDMATGSFMGGVGHRRN